MHRRSLSMYGKYLLKHTTQTVQARITSLENRINVNTFESEPQPAELGMNDIGEVLILASKPLVFDGYRTNRLTGSFILIEPSTNLTVAAGMLRPPIETVKPE